MKTRFMVLMPIVVAAMLQSRTAMAAVPCVDLMKLSLPESTITAAEEVTGGTFSLPQGTFSPPGAGPLSNLPAFCRVAVTVAPQIKIEVWLPKDAWNGRYRGEGGGGYAGTISYAGLANGIRAGYATASTDTGHPASIGGTFALNSDRTLNRQLIDDFAERSLHELAIKAKAVINTYYGSAPRYSYWNGCSTGGRQGLIAAQRFPDEYDGLVIGAPAINWDRFITAELWPQIVMRQEVGGAIADSKLKAVTTAAVAACDGSDGVMDGVINDPRKCSYDPAALACREGSDPAACLTPAEVTAVRKIWDGPVSAKRGERLWFGLERGTPLSGLAGSSPFPIATAHYQYWIRQDPAFDWKTLTEADVEPAFREAQKKFAEVIGTDDPDLQRFRKRGGKMIIWHGEADQLIFPRGTVNYYNRVVAANGGAATVDGFARLFLAPGVDHCGGGSGPNPVGLFDAMVNWVEKGAAPETINASRPLPEGGVRTRPLCAFPKTAQWTGVGSTDDAANFRCVDGRQNSRDFAVTAPRR